MYTIEICAAAVAGGFSEALWECYVRVASKFGFVSGLFISRGGSFSKIVRLLNRRAVISTKKTSATTHQAFKKTKAFQKANSERQTAGKPVVQRTPRRVLPPQRQNKSKTRHLRRHARRK